MIERAELHILKTRIKEPRRFIQVVVGPRQVGKTTLAYQLFNQCNMPGLLESADAVPAGGETWLNQIWNTARLKIKSAGSNEFLLIIDEIQKIQNWSEIVKKLWDEDTLNGTNIKLILLGSSRLLLQQGLTESLAGRFENIYLTHWSLEEMNKAFGWDPETFAWFGGYPGSAGIIGDEDRWKKYIRDSLIETSISKDILMLTRIDKPALLKNLFEIGCSWSGQILSLTKIQGQLQDAGNTTTLSNYLRLLESAGLLSGLEKFANTEIRSRSSIPRFQVHNNALLSSMSLKGFSDIRADHTSWGRVIESSIGAWLVNQAIRDNFRLYYWRNRNDEVDFILRNRDKVVAIEVKSGYRTAKSGMASFSRMFPQARTYYIDNKNLSWQEFLKINPLELF